MPGASENDMKVNYRGGNVDIEIKQAASYTNINPAACTKFVLHFRVA